MRTSALPIIALAAAVSSCANQGIKTASDPIGTISPRSHVLTCSKVSDLSADYGPLGGSRSAIRAARPFFPEGLSDYERVSSKGDRVVFVVYNEGGVPTAKITTIKPEQGWVTTHVQKCG